MTSHTQKQTCILGATGAIGFEMTVQILNSGGRVLAVVRRKQKLEDMLDQRKVGNLQGLTIMEADLFANGALSEMDIKQAIGGCDYVLNCASKPVSLMPFSRINREWGGVVSKLTKAIIGLASEADESPHVIVFCGPEYFVGYDDEISGMQKLLPKMVNSFVAAFRDNHDEAHFLMASSYKRWSVLRCGSIRMASGAQGDASRIGMDLHKDRSDYRAGKGKSLIMEDLAAYLTTKIQNGEVSEFEGQMPFLFNTRF